MVSGGDTPTEFVPIDLTQDNLSLSGESPTGGVVPPSLGNILSVKLGNIQSTTVMALIEVIVPVVALVIAEVGVEGPQKWIKKVVNNNLADTESLLSGPAEKSIWHWASLFTKFGIIAPLLNLGVGIELPDKDKDPQAYKAIEIVDTMVSFATGLQFSIAAIQHALKPWLSNRWSEAIEHTIGRIPEEIGMSWALGMTIERVFEAAFGEALLDYIRSKVRPNKPEWQIARAMLRQHLITDDQLTEILQDAGFSDPWITAIKGLENQPIPVGDIGALYRQGLIDDKKIDPLIKKLGFTDEVATLLKELYITNAETSTGAQIRAVWRTLYRDGLASEQDYRDKLSEVNFPKRLIDSDIEAIKDEIKYGWRMQNVAVIKSAYIHAPGTQSTAVSKLQSIGYSHDDALAMVASWTAPPIRKQHGLSQSQILKYYIAKLLDRPKALTQLLAIGVDSDSANFLLDHPTTASGSHIVRLTPALITQAYIAGAIDQSDLKTLYTKAGATPETVQYLYDTAVYKFDKAHHLGVGDKPLSEGNVLSAFKYGIYDQPTAFNALVAMGYSQANAFVLLEIEEHGPITPPQQPPFPDAHAAYEYLMGMGLILTPSIDPLFEAAISMVEQAGISVSYPVGFHPPLAGLPWGSGEGTSGGPGPGPTPLPPPPVPTPTPPPPLPGI